MCCRIGMRWRWLKVPLQPDQLGLHECGGPLRVKVCASDAPCQHVVVGSLFKD